MGEEIAVCPPINTKHVLQCGQSVKFNAGIKSLRSTLPDEIFTGDFAS
jgi:hypothetical protein